jgi:hypothetical protein
MFLFFVLPILVGLLVVPLGLAFSVYTGNWVSGCFFAFGAVCLLGALVAKIKR